MWVRGAENFYDKESGLIKEFEERIIKYNDELCPSVTDAVLYDMVFAEKNIELFLNASVMDADIDLMEDLTDGKDRIIKSVTAWQLTTYTFIKVNAAVFADCSGDSILAELTGAEYMKGRESQTDYGESLAAAEKAGCEAMGIEMLTDMFPQPEEFELLPYSALWAYQQPQELTEQQNTISDITWPGLVKCVSGTEEEFDANWDNMVNELEENSLADTEKAVTEFLATKLVNTDK